MKMSPTQYGGALASADLLTALEKREFLARVLADFAGGVRNGVNGRGLQVFNICDLVYPMR